MAFGNAVQVTGVRDRAATGNFEVTLATDAGEELLHSKKTRGQGKCQSAEEKQAVIDAIAARLAAAKGDDE